MVHMAERPVRRPPARTPPLNVNKLVHKINRTFSIVLGAYICNLDLMGGYEAPGCPTPAERAPSARWLPRRLHKSTWTRRLRWPWVPWLLLAFALGLFCALSVHTIHLYRHDVARMRLERARELIAVYGPARRVAFDDSNFLERLFSFARSGRLEAASCRRHQHPQHHQHQDQRPSWRGATMQLGQLERLLMRRLNETRRTLARGLADGHQRFGVASQIVYLTILLCALPTYILPQWVLAWMDRPDFQVLRDIIDARAESQRVDLACEREMRKYFVNLSDTSQVVAAARATVPVDTAAATAAAAPSPRAVAKAWLECGWPRMSDHELQQILAQMLASGALRPANRTRAWLERRNRLTAAMYVWFLFGFVCLVALAELAVGSAARGAPSLGHACALPLLILAACGTTNYATPTIICHLDQFMLVKQTIFVINECVRTNELEAHSLLKPHEHQQQQQNQRSHHHHHHHHNHLHAERTIQHMNSNFLQALMTYKTFGAQLNAFQQSLRCAFSATIVVPFMVLLIGRVHMPYLERDLKPILSAHQLRLLAFAFSLTALGCINLVCMPICRLYAQCQQLYKSLSYLMAHVARVRAWASARGLTSGQVYNARLVAILVRELAVPKQALARFRVRSHMLGSTYNTLIRVHFWWFLLALSMLFHDSTSHEPPSPSPSSSRAAGDATRAPSFLSDPLGIWNFRLV